MRVYARISLIAAALLGIACQSPSSPDSTGGGGTITGNALQGRVVAQADADGNEQEIAGVRVSAAGQVTTTDSYGFWTLPVPRDTTQGLTIDYFRSGYAPYTYRYPLEITTSAFVQVSLMPVQIMQTVAVSQGAVISSNLGEDAMQLSIILPPDFMDADGDTVDVSVALVRPDHAEEYKRFPGDFIGVDPGMAEGRDMLRTFGTVNLSFSQNGVPIDEVRLKAPAVMQMRLDERSAAEMALGATIATWWLDTATAEWMREGAATVVEINEAKYAEWKVEHFTWWNVDVPLDTHGCIAVEFSNYTTLPAQVRSDTMLLLEGADYFGHSEPRAINDEGLAVLTGWRGHEGRIFIRYPGSPHSALRIPLTPLTEAEGSVTQGTFHIPLSQGSGVYNTGPNGVPLRPRTHCNIITREYTLKQGVLEGFVYDTDGNGIGGIEVYIRETGFITTTNPDGHFAFPHVPWAVDGSIALTVLGRSSRYYTISSQRVLRDQAHHRVNLTLTRTDITPRITSLQVSPTEALPGTTVHFSVSALDNGTGLKWNTAVSHGELQINSPSEESADAGLTYTSTLAGAWQGPADNRTATLTLTATDAGGKTVSQQVIVRWINRPPVVQISGPDAATTNDNVTYSVNALDPDADTLTYQWYINDVLQVGSQSTLETRFDTAGNYSVTVVVHDGVNAISRSHRLTVGHVNTAPQVALAGPASVTIGTDVTYTATGIDEDSDPLSYLWYINDVAQIESSAALDLTFATEGLYRVRVVVSDGFATAQRELLVVASAPVTSDPGDSTPPDTVLDSGYSGLISATTVTISFSSPATDLDHFECYLDSPPYQTCTSPLEMTALTDADYALVIRAIDTSNNHDPSPLLVTWTVDTLPPLTTILDAPDVVTTAASATFAFAAADAHGISAYLCSRDGAAYNYCESPVTYPFLPTGEHSFRVYAIDELGNAEPFAAEITWVIENSWDALALGSSHSCGLHKGKLYCWGDNSVGQLAQPIAGTTRSDIPLEVSGSHSWSRLVASNYISCGVASQDLYCWGSYPMDGTGPGSVTLETLTEFGAGLTWQEIATSGYHFCGIAAGELYCWGQNWSGQLGTGTTVDLVVPTKVGTSTAWTAVAAGVNFSCGLNAGKLYCWGGDGYGQLGDGGSNTDVYAPTQIGSSSGWTHIAAGAYHACGVDNGLYCWGRDYYGQVGDGGSNTNVSAPALIDANNDWSFMGLGEEHSCASRATDTYCWGWDNDGQLGNGSSADSQISPMLISASMSRVQAGTYHSCGLIGYTWYCWGQSASGQLGITERFDNASTPQQTDGTSTWTATTSGSLHSCGIRDGELYCWGTNSVGQLGIGGTTSTHWLTQVGVAGTWTAVEAGANHSCGISGGVLYCWGDDGSGQVGNGALTGSQLNPIAISASTSWSSVSAGQSHSCAIDAGKLFCWGSDAVGQIGNGATTGNQTVPVRIGSSTGWTSVSAGQSHSCGIDSGKLYCWGSDAGGQIGNGATTGNQVNPVQIGTSSTWTGISAGSNFTCGVDAGLLYCWGTDTYGQLGNGATTGIQTSPVQIGASTAWSSVSTGQYHACGVNSNQLHCWGNDSFNNQLGNGDTLEDQDSPQLLAGTGWSAISAANSHACGILSDALYCWGSDQGGKLGNGMADTPTYALQVP